MWSYIFSLLPSHLLALWLGQLHPRRPPHPIRWPIVRPVLICSPRSNGEAAGQRQSRNHAHDAWERQESILEGVDDGDDGEKPVISSASSFSRAVPPSFPPRWSGRSPWAVSQHNSAMIPSPSFRSSSVSASEKPIIPSFFLPFRRNF